MKCISPRKVGFKEDGKTISFSPKTHNPEHPLFDFRCGKCIECRLSYAQQWAVRCYHESKMHEFNSFITLTYDDDHLLSDRLQYSDFQNFIKRVRNLDCNSDKKIGLIVAGEYGEQTKRPHWHTIIFGWCPDDLEYKYSNDRGDKVYTSKILDELWGFGMAEVGTVTLKSAGYVARYAAKKLVHGNDGEHDYKPIFRASSKNAIGKKWLEKYYKDIFNYGDLRVEGKKVSIPRYYEKWFKENKPNEYGVYMLGAKLKKMDRAQGVENAIKKYYKRVNESRPLGFGPVKSRNEINKKLSEERYKRLQKGVQKC